MPVDRDEIIQIRDVSKTYRTKRGREVVALENVTLDMADGEFITVVGPSGCGKSTLLNMLAGLLPSSTGQILLRGTPVRASTQGCWSCLSGARSPALAYRLAEHNASGSGSGVESG